jgi:hypothetical protein
MLKTLGRCGEAKAELETCLQVFRNDPARSAMVLNSLAHLFYDQGDIREAVAQERRALALCEQLPYPGHRANSHNNLAHYLDLSGTTSALAEAPHHQLAALVYWLVSGLTHDLQFSLRGYVINFRRANTTGVPLTVPSVAELLDDAAFCPLDDWLRQRRVDVDELQTNVDQFLEMARQAALKSPTEPSP